MTTLTKTQIAIANGTTVFSQTVKDTTRDTLGKSERVIKESTNVKLGKRVTKGKFKGFRILTVTLEERKTCPLSCAHWANCYGNNMPFATRYSANADLESRMESELIELQRKNPKGFLVRLHILGDFYSVAYVNLWRVWLARFPALHVYGYTANQPNATNPKERAIGQAVLDLQQSNPIRFAVRFSGNFDRDNMTALSGDDARTENLIAKGKAFICPVQTDKTASCGTCGLCWSATKPVVFLTH
jgi:hypothetical protein